MMITQHCRLPLETEHSCSQFQRCTQVIWHALIEREAVGIVEEVAHIRTRWACVDPMTGQRTSIPADWLYDLAGEIVDE